MGLMTAAIADDDGITEEGVKGAIDLLRRDIDELCERAEALDLGTVMRHLEQASKHCSLEVPDFRPD